MKINPLHVSDCEPEDADDDDEPVSPPAVPVEPVPVEPVPVEPPPSSVADQDADAEIARRLALGLRQRR